MSKSINVPKLRFKEFSGDWEEKTLGDISSKVLYGIGSSAIAYDGVNKYLRITDIDEPSRTFMPNPLTSPDGEIEDKYKLVKGDIVFARTGASTGKTYLYNEKDGNLIYAGFLIKFHIDKANPYFVYSNTFKEHYNKWVQIMSMRSGQPGINAEEYKSLSLFLPSKQEQEKIASFLTSVDIKIEQLTKKEELLLQYKKGVMQKIFNQEIRFKADDGSEFCDWEDKKLSSVCNIKKGSQLNKETLTNQGNYPVLNGGINPSGYTANWNTESNTITISEGGNSCGYVNFVTTRFWSGGHNYSLQELTRAIYEGYLYQYLKFNELDIMNLRVGSGLPNIQKSAISNFNIIVPCFEEQLKIATFLSSIDYKIEQVQKQLNSTKKFKKALLQQMFI